MMTDTNMPQQRSKITDVEHSMLNKRKGIFMKVLEITAYLFSVLSVGLALTGLVFIQRGCNILTRINKEGNPIGIEQEEGLKQIKVGGFFLNALLPIFILVMIATFAVVLHHIANQ